MKRNFQLGNVPLLSQEGEKADYIRILDGMRILIYIGVRLPSEGFKLEDSSIWELSKVHTGALWCSESPAGLPWADIQQEVIEEARRTPPQATGPLPGGTANGLHLCSKCENVAAPCSPRSSTCCNGTGIVSENPVVYHLHTNISDMKNYFSFNLHTVFPTTKLTG